MTEREDQKRMKIEWLHTGSFHDFFIIFKEKRLKDNDPEWPGVLKPAPSK